MLLMRFDSEAICVASGLEAISFSRMFSVTLIRPSIRLRSPIRFFSAFSRWFNFRTRRCKSATMSAELDAARAVVAARRAKCPTGPMPPEEPETETGPLGPLGPLGPKLAAYMHRDPDPDLTMLAQLVALREAKADSTDVGLAIFNRLAPETLRMTREQMLSRAADTVRRESAGP